MREEIKINNVAHSEKINTQQSDEEVSPFADL